MVLRQALRDTAGHSEDPARLDTLGLALLRLGRFDDARTIYRRTLAIAPKDPGAAAALGKLALFNDHLAEAESLLAIAAASGTEPGAQNDLYAARLRGGQFAQAAEMATDVNDPGRVPMLQRLAERPAYRLVEAPDEVKIPWAKSYPVPLVRVKVNGQSALMAIDTGARDLVVDKSFAARADLTMLPLESAVFWDGEHVAMKNAFVQRLDLGSLRIEDLPAGVLSLRKWTTQINPNDEPVVGVIGLGFLRQFTPTLDYDARTLELRKPGHAYPAGTAAHRIPFEIWGESDLTVYGTLNGGRKMAMIWQSGIAGCGVAAPQSVFDEVGIKPGAMSKLMKGAGSMLQGRPAARVTVRSVAVGAMLQQNVPGWSGVMDDVELWRQGVRRDAILSHDFFKDHRVTIDWSAHQLVVEEKD
jgi:hypothetical protein